MRKIDDYETLQEFWEDLKPRLPDNLASREAAKHSRDFMTELRAASRNSTLITKLTVNEIGLATLKVSEQIDRVHGHYVSELEFIEEGTPEDDTYRIIGNLAMYGYPFQGRKYITVVVPSDIPESHQQVFDLGLQLIEVDLINPDK